MNANERQLVTEDAEDGHEGTESIPFKTIGPFSAQKLTADCADFADKDRMIQVIRAIREIRG